MKYSEYVSINKEAISLVKKSQKELERHGWSNNRFPIVGKTLKEAEEALKLSVEDLKKKREEMGEKKFNFWLKKLEKNVSDLKGRLSAWEKTPTEEEERKKKEEDLDENVFSLREEILKLSGILEEGAFSDGVSQLKGRIASAKEKIQDKKKASQAEKERAWLEELVGSDALMKNPDKVTEILTGKARIYDENKLLHYLIDVAGFSNARARKAVTNNIIIKARTKANADRIMNTKY